MDDFYPDQRYSATLYESFLQEMGMAVPELQYHVGETCDKMEYEGSMMFDEYPDRLMIRKMACDISDKIEDIPEEKAEARGRLTDLAQVMLMDEMHRRRCRYRRRRQRIWTV